MSIVLWIVAGIVCSCSYIMAFKNKDILTVGDIVYAILLLLGGVASAAILLVLFMSYAILEGMKWVVWSRYPIRLRGMKPVLDIDYTANTAYAWNGHCVNSSGKLKIAILLDAPEDVAKYICDMTDYGDSLHHKEAADKLKKLIYSRDDDSDTLLISTHNVTLISNDTMRPDCYFIYKDGRAVPFHKLTNKELRIAHNIDKMYLAGDFDYEGGNHDT